MEIEFHDQIEDPNINHHQQENLCMNDQQAFSYSFNEVQIIRVFTFNVSIEHNLLVQSFFICYSCLITMVGTSGTILTDLNRCL